MRLVCESRAECDFNQRLPRGEHLPARIINPYCTNIITNRATLELPKHAGQVRGMDSGSVCQFLQAWWFDKILL